MAIDWSKLGDGILDALKAELIDAGAEAASLGVEALTDLRSVAEKIARYTQEEIDGKPNAERLLGHAKAELSLVLADHQILASRTAIKRAEALAVRLGKMAIAVLGAVV